MVALKTAIPLPVLVIPKAPLIAPERVNCVPLTSTVELAPSVTVPDKIALPVLVFKMPPFKVMASGTVIAPCKSNTALALTMVL